MRIYFNLTNDGYLTGWSNTRSSEDELSIWVDKDHEVLRIPEIFKYEDGELIKDEDKQQRLIEEDEKRKNKPSELEELRQENDKLALALMDLAEITLNIGGDE